MKFRIMATAALAAAFGASPALADPSFMLGMSYRLGAGSSGWGVTG